jgi:HEAT repeat protein
VEKQIKRKYRKMKKQMFGIVLIALFVAGCVEEQTTGSTAAAERMVRTQSLKPRAKIILENGLKSENAHLRSSAIEVMVETGQKDMLPHITRLTTDPVVPVRFNATVALGDMRCFSCEKIVRKSLNDPDVNVRIAAAYSLVKLDQPQFVEQLRAAAKNSDQTVRANAALLLGKLGKLNTTESRNAIISKLDDEVQEVRLVAAEQLARLGDKHGEEQVYAYFQTQPDLNKMDMANQTAIMAIGPLKNSQLNSFLPKALDSQSPYIQLLAARSVLLQLK